MKSMTAAALAALMLTTGAFAEEPETRTWVPAPSLSGNITAPQPGVVSTVWEILEEGRYEGFLQDLTLPDGVTMKEIDLESPAAPGQHHSLALLTLKEGGARVNALAFHAEYEPKGAEEPFRNLFEDPRILKTTVADMYALNVLFLKSENTLNDFFMHRVAEKRDEWGYPDMPFSTLTVDFLEAEQLHKLRDNPRVYSMGVRALLLADDWAVPLYAKMYTVKHGKHYRMLVLLAPDSANEAVRKYGDRIAVEMGKSNEE